MTVLTYTASRNMNCPNSTKTDKHTNQTLAPSRPRRTIKAQTLSSRNNEDWNPAEVCHAAPPASVRKPRTNKRRSALIALVLSHVMRMTIHSEQEIQRIRDGSVTAVATLQNGDQMGIITSSAGVRWVE